MMVDAEDQDEKARRQVEGSCYHAPPNKTGIEIDTESLAPQNTRLILRRGTQAANGGRL